MIGAVIVAVVVLGPAALLIHTTSTIRHSLKNAAPGTLRTIHGAQVTFKAHYGRFGTLKELADAGLISPHYASGKPFNGYAYSDSDLSENTFCIHADRQSNDAGESDFSLTESGDIHFIKSLKPGTVPRGAGEKMVFANESQQ